MSDEVLAPTPALRTQFAADDQIVVKSFDLQWFLFVNSPGRAFRRSIEIRGRSECPISALWVMNWLSRFDYRLAVWYWQCWV